MRLKISIGLFYEFSIVFIALKVKSEIGLFFYVTRLIIIEEIRENKLF